MNKKAVEFNIQVVVTIILIILAVIVLIMFAKDYLNQIKDLILGLG